jgi:hypothetical protein
MDKYKAGEWKALCDICVFEFKASELVQDWRGWRVCSKDLDKRNPQEFVRPKTETIGVPWARPDDSEGVVVEQTTDLILTASFDDLSYLLGDGVTTVELPTANNATYLGIPVNLVFLNTTSGIITFSVIGSALVGGTQLLPDATARFREL